VYLYLLTRRPETVDWSEIEAAVVAATSPMRAREEARKLDASSAGGPQRGNFWSDAHLEGVGVAKPGAVAGIVLASYKTS
jgi:hypothetical protein